MTGTFAFVGRAIRSRHAMAWMVVLAAAGKGLSFIREAFVAAQLGASSASDSYYLALAMPTLIYSLGAIPFSMWVTARLAALRSSGAQARKYYADMLWLTVGAGTGIACILALTPAAVVSLYAPALTGDRLLQAESVTRVGLIAIPGLGAQAICNGKLFAERRFRFVYASLVLSSVCGLGTVVALTPRLGAAGAVWGFVTAAWASLIGPLLVSRGNTSHGVERVDTWVDDLGVSVVYRALALQVYFQLSSVLLYNFGSGLPAGELAAAVFGTKIQNALYETLAVTAGALVYPKFASLLQRRDYPGVGATLVRALAILVPVAAALSVLLITCRSEIVSLIYERKAFDARAAQLVTAAILGLAPGVIGLTLVEICHRVMVLRGRLPGYVGIFGAALIGNWALCRLAVQRLGVLGLTLASSAGVLLAALGLLVYAIRRLEAVEKRALVFLILRTLAAVSIALAVITPIRNSVTLHPTSLHQLLVVLGVGGAAVGILGISLTIMGHRWGWLPE